jgi:hypothetical protein
MRLILLVTVLIIRGILTLGHSKTHMKLQKATVSKDVQQTYGVGYDETAYFDHIISRDI